ncbi:hypothetical protein AAMO2058_000382100 [Amorphochlora amoebiformis]
MLNARKSSLAMVSAAILIVLLCLRDKHSGSTKSDFYNLRAAWVRTCMDPVSAMELALGATNSNPNRPWVEISPKSDFSIASYEGECVALANNIFKGQNFPSAPGQLQGGVVQFAWKSAAVGAALALASRHRYITIHTENIPVPMKSVVLLYLTLGDRVVTLAKRSRPLMNLALNMVVRQTLDRMTGHLHY